MFYQIVLKINLLKLNFITLLNALEDYNASIHVHPYYSNVFAYNSMEIPINSNVMEYYVGKLKW